MEDRGIQTSDTEDGDYYAEIRDPVASEKIAIELHPMDVNSTNDTKQVGGSNII